VVLNESGNTGGWTPASGDILRVWERFDGGIEVKDEGGASQVDFLPDGATDSMTLCLKLKRSSAFGTQKERHLEINSMGRAWVVSKDDVDVMKELAGPCKSI
jgi:hypothetical protein